MLKFSIKSKRLRLGILLLTIALVAGGFLLATSGGQMVLGFAYWSAKMWQGKRYLRSLSQEEKLEWIRDADALLKVDSLRSKCIGAVKKNDSLFLPKYKRLGVIRVDVCGDRVNFMWMGGFDHTGLYIRKDKLGAMRMTVGFNDYERQEIYPEVKDVQNDLKRR